MKKPSKKKEREDDPSSSSQNQPSLSKIYGFGGVSGKRHNKGASLGVTS